MANQKEAVTGDVVTYTQLDGDVVKKLLLGEGKLAPIAEDPEAARGRIMRRLFEGTWEDVTSPSNLIQGKDLIDVPFEVRAVEWFESDFDEGVGFFSVVTAVMLADAFEASAGDIVKISLGSEQVLALLYRAWAEDRLPWRCVQRQADKPTRRGFKPRWLESWKEVTA
jgi:hypothetical protein